MLMTDYAISIDGNTPNLNLVKDDTLTVKFSGAFLFGVTDPDDFNPSIVFDEYGPRDTIKATVCRTPDDASYGWVGLNTHGQRTIHVSSTGPLALLEDKEVRRLLCQNWPSVKLLGQAILRSKHLPFTDSAKKIVELVLQAGDTAYQKAGCEAGKSNS